MGSMKWKQVELPALQPLLKSDQTTLLPSTSWPAWARESTQVKRLWAYCPKNPGTIPSTHTTVAVVARLLAERYDHKDAKPWNYNYYLLLQSTDGRIFQSPPLRTTDLDHHSSGPLSIIGPGPRASTRADA